MPGFEYSSSPPSTPNRSINSRFSFGNSNNPSTTPAGAPHSSAGSYTPAGPAPSSFLESTMRSPTPNKSAFGYSEYSQQSDFDQSQLNFGHSELQSPQFSSPLFTRPASKPQREVFGSKSQKSQRNLRSPSRSEEEEEEEDDENTGFDTNTRKRYAQSFDDDQDMRSEDGDYEDEDVDDYRSESRGTKSMKRNIYNQHSNSVRFASTSGSMRQSKGNQLVDFRGSLAEPQGEKVQSSDFASIAKTISQGLGIPAVDEEDDLILKTEAIITKLYDQGVGKADNEEKLQRALAVIPSELTALWQEYSERSPVDNEEEYASVIGPGPAASEFAKANYLAHLALQIHHSKPVEKGSGTVVKPLPQILLDWLDEYHNPFRHQLPDIQFNRPSPAAHQLFWTTMHNNIVRGKVMTVINYLKSAGWRYSWSDADDVAAQGGADGFTGVALANVEKVVDDAINVLSLCPAVHGDWNIHGSDWKLFRLRISQAIEDLKHFAEGGAHHEPARGPSIRSSRGGEYSNLAKRAASRVPWNIYQNLLTLYSLAMGESIPIIENSQDWCEATIGLLLWHDEEKDQRRLAPGRSINSLRASVMNYESGNDIRKLRRAFEVVAASNTDFHVNSNDMVEVGLACLFQGDTESLICILRAWSGPVSSALAEVASLTGWLPRTEPQGLLAAGELDQEDLDLINFGGSTVQDGVKDLTLITYARSLQDVPELSAVIGHAEIKKEGWELAIAVLGRLDSEKRSEDMVEEIMRTVNLDSAGIVDKLWRLLNDLGMSSQAEAIAMSYADSLARDNISPGEALWYYALAHNSAKVKDVLDTLIQLCLVYSTAYPPETELDDHLQRLISSPKNAISEMSSMDIEAAELVHTSLSGYATLRRFYTLRDQEVALSPGTKPSMGAIVRRSEAANALLALIISSDDNIRGGIYDEARGAVIPIHYILALLGEAMPFVNQPDSLLSTSQIDILLRTMEDIQGIGPRIYSVCNAFLETVIKNASGLKGSNPMDLLSKSSSGTSGSFSMVGSSMMASQFHKSVTASGLLNKENINRGWDWRKGIKAGMTAEDILRMLRLGLAKDLARAWLEETDDMS
ncbi:hypothetical protein SBOR_9141 [Sclerotinia borealis F-4128]|uniref:Nuclear pore complex protein Nup85 n=1 Tax=Sclerotinia borealis (strain F-4128) TaxID=1432307 RepID=W9C6D9_SCLBF|nr:hypothetical protein SBOR_9141 [Sclerotinia borealis F-4128]